MAAGERRLMQELGFTAPLKDLGWFHYNAHFENGLSENEIDHVLIGEMPAGFEPTPNPDEIHAFRWVTLADLDSEMQRSPELFTPWLRAALNIAKEHTPAYFS